MIVGVCSIRVKTWISPGRLASVFLLLQFVSAYADDCIISTCTKDRFTSNKPFEEARQMSAFDHLSSRQ